MSDNSDFPPVQLSVSSENYITRSIEPVIKEALGDTPVVCLLGPRQCGKTTLAKQLDPARPLVSLDDNRLLSTARLDPQGFIAELPAFVTIDEVQHAPELLPVIKLAVDTHRRSGRFLLTGSANLLLLPAVSESLAGRMEVIRLHPLSESEKESASGAFLSRLLANDLDTRIRSSTEPVGLPVSQRLVSGGFPEPIGRPLKRARQWFREYVRSIIERDIRDVAEVRDIASLSRLLEVLAHRTASLLNVSSMANELRLNRATVERYLLVLERLFLVRRLPAWHRNRAAGLAKAPKLHMMDSGLCAVLSDLTTDDWQLDRTRMGHLLESFTVQQFFAQAGWTDPDVRFHHYRDKDKVEVDIVITLGRKVWGVEIKSSSSISANDGRGLLRLAEQCGKDFQRGILLHTGPSPLPMKDSRMTAMPISELWTI